MRQLLLLLEMKIVPHLNTNGYKVLDRYSEILRIYHVVFVYDLQTNTAIKL